MPASILLVPNSKSPAKRGNSHRSAIHDVARIAGVTIYTVSRALNNVAGVNPQTRERVLEICREFGIRPRVTSRCKHLALAIHDDDRTHPSSYSGMFTFELLAEVSSRGMALSLFTDKEMPEMTRQIFDGIFALTWNERTLNALARIGTTPVVVVNRFGFAPQFDVVGWDHHDEGRTVAEYLVKTGHRRVAMVVEPTPDTHSIQSRAAGFRERCVKAGLDAKSVFIEVLETRSQLASALSRVVSFRADALYVPGQGMLGPEAAEILQHVLKVHIADDLSLVVGEHPGWTAVFYPPLTSVDAPIGQLAKRCVDHMLAVIGKARTSPIEVLMVMPIIERQSVLNRRELVQRLVPQESAVR